MKSQNILLKVSEAKLDACRLTLGFLMQELYSFLSFRE